VVHYSDTIEG